MKLENEKQLLFIIRYGLIILILFLSFVITTFLYLENKSTFEKIKKNTSEKFISAKKQIIKDQVDNLYDYILSEQRDTEAKLKESLKSRVYEAHKIISNIYEQYKNTHTKEELRVLMRTAIKDIRFNNERGYFFVNSIEGRNVIHGLNPALEGKNLLGHKDVKGKYVLKDLLDLLKDKDELFHEWYWRKSKTDLTEYKKIGFVKNFKELDWFVGTGEYFDDFSKDIQQNLLVQINRLRFGENGYFFAFNENNIYLSNIRKDVIGKSVFENNNLKNTRSIMDKMWQKAESGGGFIEYVQKINPITNKPTIKIAYVKYIPKWYWLVGTGFYENDVQALIDKEKEILTSGYENNLYNLFLVSLLATVILLALSYYISYLIEKKFKNYKNSIQSYMDENKKQYELLSQRSKLTAMGEMLENIAHQWRQPLSLITTASSGIRVNKELDNLNDDFLYEALDSIEYGANHLTETIEDFRDFFRTDKQMTLFSSRICFDKTFKLLFAQLKSMNIEVIENIEDIEIKGYERELLQVLLNIFKNAMDALEKVDGEKYIFVNIYNKENILHIEIKDNAGGVKEEIIERIFEPYYTTKHQSQGTGIGLYMSEEIINKHMKGNLEVKNSTYEYKDKTFTGALFTIKLSIN